MTIPRPTLVAICISAGGIPKRPLPAGRVSFAGLEGDGHAHEKHRTPLQALCLQDLEKLKELNQLGYALTPGAAGENLTVEHLCVNQLPLGTVLNFSGGVQMELTKIRKPCYVMNAIGPRLMVDALGRHGMYARVLKEGVLTQGETIEVIKPPSQDV